jgi:hypothetical protein
MKGRPNCSNFTPRAVSARIAAWMSKTSWAPALALVCAGGLLWLRRARRATLRELQQLSRLRDELGQDP